MGRIVAQILGPWRHRVTGVQTRGCGTVLLLTLPHPRSTSCLSGATRGQSAHCNQSTKHSGCPLPELPPPPAGPCSCCWCCFHYRRRACLQSCCECCLCCGVPASCPFLMFPVSAGVCSLPASHPLQSPLCSVPVVGSPSQLPSPGSPVAVRGPRSAPQGLDTELPPSGVFTWAFVHPPGQSPPWRQLRDEMASLDTAWSLYKSFVTRCSPPGLPAYLTRWPAKSPVCSWSLSLPLPRPAWEPLAAS